MTTPTNHGPAELQRVITLLLVNLALTALLAVLFAVFHTSLLDYQIQRMGLPDTPSVRAGLSVGLWSRLVTVAIFGVVYAFVIRSLRRGRRRAYVRVLILSVMGLVGAAYLVFSAQYPAWVDVEQGVQALVLLGLLWAVTRPAVRAHFAKPVTAGADRAR
jgi:cytochrome bd-type quinol oxidase subunit 2